MSNPQIDQLFDLDLALTTVDDSASVIEIADTSAPHRNDLPPVTAASGVCTFYVNGNQLFDLDLALTMADDSATGVIGISDSVVPHRNEMPTVPASGVCTVCMEGFRSGEDGKQVPCGHLYHEVCIIKWLSLHNSCPLCRFQVSVKERPVHGASGAPQKVSSKNRSIPASPARLKIRILIS
ncbi:unnamed protein product [Ilex paraguariensis]|uniref:RING-type E3 ubiquitin transferase n=1 Tax=Ilex paraguariensis TaxID=185542 RepID=A0ABC8QZE5_9AQUA